jgi:hypothetical protein
LTISKPVSLSGSETVVKPGTRSCKSTCLNMLDVRKSFVVFIYLPRSDELRLNNLLLNLAISNSGFKAASSNAFCAGAGRSLAVMLWFF